MAAANPASSVTNGFLPTSLKEMRAEGWENVDIILFSGDAYVDHPSFGPPLIGRVLQAAGYRVALVPQPNWKDDLRDFTKLGRPRLFFALSSGNMDSMVNRYTAAKRIRSRDAYTPDGRTDRRPDYAVTVYSRILKRLYPDVPLVIGGIEASLRRLSHYDYWSDSLKPSILVDSFADILVYGMGERPVLALAAALRDKASPEDLHGIPQIAYLRPRRTSAASREDPDTLVLPSHEACIGSKAAFAAHFGSVERELNSARPRRMIEACRDREVVVNPPFPPMTTAELDAVYDLPFTFRAHPRYKNKTVPALEMIRFSVCLHRGCFGGCSFCTIAAHQGKQIVSRSEASVLREIERLKVLPEFKGFLSDLGGPTANMYGLGGKDKSLCERCSRPSCLFPRVCRNLDIRYDRLLHLYARVRECRGIKKAFIGSGIRYDLFLNEKGFLNEEAREYFETLLRYHVSGRLKVAPEHTEPQVLECMGKPSFALFERLRSAFDRFNREQDSRLQLIPYFISSHPACRLYDMKALAQVFAKEHITAEQVQDFTPTPMTRSSVMYYSGMDPASGKKVFCERDGEAKKRQKQCFFS